MPPENSWPESRALVLAELKRFGSSIHELRNAIQASVLRNSEENNRIREDIAGLRANARLWGAVAALVIAPVAVAVIEVLLRIVLRP